MVLIEVRFVHEEAHSVTLWASVVYIAIKPIR
jgi:hypothetical protein